MSTKSHLICVKEGHLCLRCQVIFSLTPTSGDGSPGVPRIASYNINSTIRDLEEMGQYGCYTCNELLKDHCIWNRGNPYQIQICYEIVLYPSSGRPNSYNLYLEVVLKAEGDDGSLARTFLEFSQPRDQEIVPDVQVLGTSTGSEETVDFIRRKLKHCNTYHPLCATCRPTSTWYPTRLIDVNLSKQQDCPPRLILTSETQTTEPYISLSHCWGGVKTMSLTQNTLHQFMQRIDNSQIPKTFLDAFSLARSLGIRYIWIDSLCIMQDSEEDWNREADMMLKVYQHAYFNIAANHSHNCHTGLFANRHPRSMSLILQVQYDTFAGTFKFTRGQKLDSESLWSPLYRRAWVVQERYISSRIINFGPDQVLWDCYESLASEQYPEKVPFGGESFKMNHGLLHVFLSELHFLNKWNNIIAQYSASRLTFPEKDQVVAISSIAQYLQELWGIEYCAGLWRKHIELQLTWRAWQEGLRRRFHENVAPSWSWLSYHGGLGVGAPSWDISTYKKLANVTDVRVRQEQSGFGNRVLRGYIEIRCFLHRLTAKDAGDGQYFWVAPQSDRHIESRVHLDYPEDRHNEMFFVPLYRCRQELEDEVFGLAVAPSGGANGCYVRCGVVIDRCPDSHSVLRESREIENIPCIEFDEHDGYLIRLN